MHEVNAQISLLAQAEAQTALDNQDGIARVESVDGIFIGPADLSASMAYVNNPAHSDVQNAITNAITPISNAGNAAGILTPDTALAKHYLAIDALFVAVGLDTHLLVRHTSALAARLKILNLSQLARFIDRTTCIY